MMNNKTHAENDGLVLTGLDGSNPLAFLAALGTLRTLGLAWPKCKVRMHWGRHGGAWRPIITATGEKNLTKDDCLKDLGDHLASRFEDHPLNQLEANDTRDSDPYSPTSCWTSALRSELAPEATSQLQTVRRDYFVGNLKTILAATTKEHLQRALFRQWDYRDALDNQSLHLDPTEDRRHAYQWTKPSGDPARKKHGGMLGANRLAIEAFPFFQSFAAGDRLTTRGFRGTRADNTRWTWPIWTCTLCVEVVASLLAQDTLQNENLDSARLRATGVVTAYRSQRILVEKTPNLTPAVAVF